MANLRLRDMQDISLSIHIPAISEWLILAPIKILPRSSPRISLSFAYILICNCVTVENGKKTPEGEVELKFLIFQHVNLIPCSLSFLGSLHTYTPMSMRLSDQPYFYDMEPVFILHVYCSAHAKCFQARKS